MTRNIISSIAKNLALLSYGVLFSGCGNLPPGRIQTGENIQPAEANQIAKGLSSKKLSATSQGIPEVKVAAQPSLDIASEGSALKVPVLKLSFANPNSGSAQIIRCATTSSLAQKFAKEATTKNASSDEQKWLWAEAWSDHSCQVIVTHLSRTIYQDVTAEDGTFFYIVNPCRQSSGSNESVECSYQLSVTEPLEYKNQSTAIFRETAKRLATLEGQLAASYSRLQAFSQTIAAQQQACEKNSAVDASLADFWKGIATVGATGAGAIIGGMISGGPGAFQSAQTTLKFALKLFSENNPTKPICPAIDTLLRNAERTAHDLPEIEQAVVEARLLMAQQNAQYARIDAKLLDDDERDQDSAP